MQNRMARMAAIGTDFAASVAAGGVLGYLIDRWRGSEPWGLLIGLILGIVVGFVRFMRDALAMTRADARRMGRARSSEGISNRTGG